MHKTEGLSWLSIIRLGFAQAALGAIVVLTTSTLNRVMVVELSLAAVIPGALVGLHYGVQILRPVWGHQADKRAHGKHGRTLWILGGIGLLAASGTAAAASTFLFENGFWAGLILALGAYTCIGFGIGMAGTSLLALLANRTAHARRPAAAAIVWIMMIAGIAITAGVSGSMLDPYSHATLVRVTATVGFGVFAMAALAIWGVEAKSTPVDARSREGQSSFSFKEGFLDTWHDPEARLFTVFVFVSMLAYSTQDLILEPFGGMLFGMTPGETTKLSGVQHGGVLIGMLIAGGLGTLLSKRKPAVLRAFTVFGCLGSGIALGLLALSTAFAPHWPITLNVVALGVANGAFAVAAIGSMMMLAGAGKKSREGMRMGLWGAAQAIAFGLGGFMGTVALDISRAVTGDIPLSFSIVFWVEAALFLASAVIATRIGYGTAASAAPTRTVANPFEAIG